MEDKKYTVYQFTFPNNKRYFGITSTPVKYRWMSGEGYHNMLVGNAIRKYGWDNVVKEVLAVDLSAEDAQAIEAKLISDYNTTDSNYGYNVSPGGGLRPTRVVSAETRAKISAANKGRKRSEATKQKLRESALNMSPEARARCRRGPGYKHSEEVKDKIREASKRMWATSRERMLSCQSHHTHSEETRKRISERQKGMPKPDWLRAKYSLAAKNRSPEELERRARRISTPILCITTNKLYKTFKEASIHENVSEERISYSCKHQCTVKGLEFKQYPRGTDVNELAAELDAQLV